MLFVENLLCGYGKKTVLRGITFAASPGEVLCLLGPNGVGKTTFFKTLLGILPPLGGGIRFGRENLLAWSPRERARRMAYVPQSHSLPFGFSVLEMVLMGRTSHLGIFGQPLPRDEKIARKALEDLEIERLALRSFGSLSGGEKQLVLVARALAQEPEILVMDEPTANLDFRNRYRILERIRLLGKRGFSVLFSSHAPEQALDVAAKTVLFGPRGFMGAGSSREMVTSDSLSDLYDMPIDLVRVPHPERKDLVFPLPLEACGMR